MDDDASRVSRGCVLVGTGSLVTPRHCDAYSSCDASSSSGAIIIIIERERERKRKRERETEEEKGKEKGMERRGGGTAHKYVRAGDEVMRSS
jgi:hypothetical protein